MPGPEFKEVWEEMQYEKVDGCCILYLKQGAVCRTLLHPYHCRSKTRNHDSSVCTRVRAMKQPIPGSNAGCDSKEC